MEWLIFIGIGFLILKGIFGEDSSPPPPPPVKKKRVVKKQHIKPKPKKVVAKPRRVTVKTSPKIRTTSRVNHNLSTPQKRTNWQNFQQILKENNITTLYHFTDSSNINSIQQNGGLFSWYYMENNGLQIPTPGGDGFSRQLDRRKGLQDYVRLSFNKNHPMMYVAQRDGRITNPKILEIDPKVIYWSTSKYSDRNAADNSAEIGKNISDFRNISFHIATRNNYIEDEFERKLGQAEVLIKTHLPIDFINNLNNPQTYRTTRWSDDDLPF